MAQFKSAQVALLKAPGNGGDELPLGQFEALVSVFDNKDSYGDVVRPGAFVDTLDEWAKSGRPIPIYYSHRMDDPDFNIGHVLEAKEVAKDELADYLKKSHPAGLYAKGQLDLEDPTPTSKAPQVYRLLKGDRLTQFSYAYDVVEGAYVEQVVDGKDDSYFELKKLALWELGPTPVGANTETDLLGVKHAIDNIARSVTAAKAGRTLSSKNESILRDARDALDKVLASLEPDEEKAQQTATGQHGGAPAGANVEEPTAKSTATASILTRLRIMEMEV